MTNTVTSVQNPKVVSIQRNPNVITVGMKFTDVYKVPHLFADFKAADVDEDGIISESEYELHSEKNDLKNEAFMMSNNARKFNKEHGYWALGLAGVTAVGLLTTSVSFMAVPLALGALLAIGGLMAVTLKQNKKADKYMEQAFEKCKKLDEEYRLKLDQAKSTDSK